MELRCSDKNGQQWNRESGNGGDDRGIEGRYRMNRRGKRWMRKMAKWKRRENRALERGESNVEKYKENGSKVDVLKRS